MHPVVVTASTLMELSLLVAGASAVPLAGFAHLQAFRGQIGGNEVILAVTGIGKVNAATAATILLERLKPTVMVNTGCGGAFSDAGLSLCDLAVASSETFADEGVQTPEGWRGLELIGIPVVQGEKGTIFNTIPLHPTLAASAADFATASGLAVSSGPFLTVSTCSGSSRQGEEVLRRFPGICENMEGAAIAQVALLYDVPFLEVRGISNMVEDRDLSRWDLKGAVTAAQKFLLAYLETVPPSLRPSREQQGRGEAR